MKNSAFACILLALTISFGNTTTTKCVGNYCQHWYSNCLKVTNKNEFHSKINCIIGRRKCVKLCKVRKLNLRWQKKMREIWQWIQYVIVEDDWANIFVEMCGANIFVEMCVFLSEIFKSYTLFTVVNNSTTCK